MFYVVHYMHRGRIEHVSAHRSYKSVLADLEVEMVDSDEDDAGSIRIEMYPGKIPDTATCDLALYSVLVGDREYMLFSRTDAEELVEQEKDIWPVSMPLRPMIVDLVD